MASKTFGPDTLHDPTPYGYSHTALIPAGSELVVVAGQYASDPEGQVVAGGFVEQVRRALHNLSVALGAHGMELAHVVQLRTYVVGLNFERLGAVGEAVKEIWSTQLPAHTIVGVAALAQPDIQVEFEAMAARERPSGS